MTNLFLDALNRSISAGWLVLAVVILRFLLKKAPKWCSVLLWGIVAFRLLCPFTIESVLSLIPSTETIRPEIMLDWTPEISTGIAPLDQVVNPVISSSFAPKPWASANPLQILIPVGANLWLLGILLMLLYTAISYWCLHRKVTTAVRYKDNIFQSEHVDSPFVLGILKPKIYLPFQMHAQDILHVIAHEQAHIRRKDHWWKPLGFLLLALYWFHPLMWLAYALLCRDIELACDEKVIQKLDHNQRADYSQALVTCSVNRRSITACPLAFGEVSVKERVKSVMNYKKPTFWIVSLALISCVLVAVCFLTNPVSSHEEDTENQYYLLIGADNIAEIGISTPFSSGGCINADHSTFKKGEKVWLEQLTGVSDLRGVTITAQDQAGTVVYTFSVPENATKDEIIKLMSADDWLLAPNQVMGAEPPVPEQAETRNLIPMVMVDGKLYLDMGLEDSTSERTDHSDGEITSQVDQNQKPTVDNQSNFGTGYPYQYGRTEGTIELCINGKWWVFATEEVRARLLSSSINPEPTPASVSVINFKTGEELVITSRADLQTIQTILSAQWWDEGTPACDNDFKLTVNGEHYGYHSDCGTLSDIAHDKSIPLSLEQMDALYRILTGENGATVTHYPAYQVLYAPTPADQAEENNDSEAFVITKLHYQDLASYWVCGDYSYSYRLLITGRLPNATKNTTYIVLSNREDITFDEAWRASGLSSNLDDYFDPGDAVIVGSRFFS